VPATVRVEDPPGIALEVPVREGQKTGLFLDQRANRGRLRSLARGRSVLNLVAHSCSFTVAAAAGLVTADRLRHG
jgi:23S rRNA (cytosine1962-C5)-methyltransferase